MWPNKPAARRWLVYRAFQLLQGAPVFHKHSRVRNMHRRCRGRDREPGDTARWLSRNFLATQERGRDRNGLRQDLDLVVKLSDSWTASHRTIDCRASAEIFANTPRQARPWRPRNSDLFRALVQKE